MLPLVDVLGGEGVEVEVDGVVASFLDGRVDDTHVYIKFEPVLYYQNGIRVVLLMLELSSNCYIIIQNAGQATDPNSYVKV